MDKKYKLQEDITKIIVHFIADHELKVNQPKSAKAMLQMNATLLAAYQYSPHFKAMVDCVVANIMNVIDKYQNPA